MIVSIKKSLNFIPCRFFIIVIVHCYFLVRIIIEKISAIGIERSKPKINITDKMLKEYKDKCEDKPILRNSIHTFQGQLAYKKQDTMFQKENDLVMENYYKQAEKKLEHCMDGLVDGSMSFSDYKRNVKEINGIL